MGSTQQDFDQPDYAEGTPVGEVLRRARQHYGLSLEDVEGALRIRLSHLEALEEGRADKLPGRVYAIGFIRAYAEYLGLDGGKIVHLFKTQAGQSQGLKPELHFPAAAAESKVPNLYVLAGSFVALAGIFFVLSFLTQDKGGALPDHIPTIESLDAESRGPGIAVTGESPLERAVVMAIEAAAGPEGPSVFVTPQGRITVTVTENAWVEIRDSKGKAILSRILKAGDSYLVPDEPGLLLSTGNAGGLVLDVNGQKVPPLGATGDILRKIPLDAAALKQAAATAAAAKEEKKDRPQENTVPAEESVIVRTPRDREGM